MKIKRKEIFITLLGVLTTLTLFISLIVATTIRVEHDGADLLIHYNRILTFIGIPMTSLYLYLLYRLKNIRVFKYLFYIALVLSVLSTIYNLFFFDALIYIRYGRDWNNSAFFYVVTYLVLAFISFMDKEPLAVKMYFILSFLLFFLFDWYPDTMFGSNLTVVLALEFSEFGLLTYIVASYTVMGMFMYFINYNDKKIDDDYNLQHSEKDDFHSYIKNKE